MNGDRDTSLVLRGLAVLVYVLLLAPVAIVIVISFSADSFIVFPPSGFSLRWYERLIDNEKTLETLRRSSLPRTGQELCRGAGT